MSRGRNRIVLVSHSKEVGGAELHLERLAVFLVEPLGAASPPLSLELICRRDPALDRWVERIEASGVTVRRLDLRGPVSLLRLLRLIGGARLVHLHVAHPVGKYQLLAALAARLTRRRTLATHHLALDIRQIPLGRSRRILWFWLFRWWIAGIDRHITVSAYAREVLRRVYRLPPSRIAVIYVGTDVRRFRPPGPEERTGLRYQLWNELTGQRPPSQLSIVCSVARLSPQKGLGDLIEAARLIDQPATRYVVIGGGPLRAPLSTSLNHLGLAGTVLLTGDLASSDVGRWLQAADIFVLPSHFEGGPATALTEAMASGCAVVATRVSGTEELVPGDDVGVLVEPRDPRQLAAAITDLLADPERRARLGRRARARVVGAFDIRQSQEKTLEIYRAMVS